MSNEEPEENFSFRKGGGKSFIGSKKRLDVSDNTSNDSNGKNVSSAVQRKSGQFMSKMPYDFRFISISGRN